jgi:hypothetical protein
MTENAAGNHEFETWLRTVCFQEPTPEAYDLAKSAWKEVARRRGELLRKLRGLIGKQYLTEAEASILVSVDAELKGA